MARSCRIFGKILRDHGMAWWSASGIQKDGFLSKYHGSYNYTTKNWQYAKTQNFQLPGRPLRWLLALNFDRMLNFLEIIFLLHMTSITIIF